ncbi:AfsR/SARP family transcriptional regulator [Streptomyces odontomachi]|uniref:AfsR/SARP family transcriptional regulator n=1 Tax=Streptomyces odontomachi TaxID=2944940 RepID=UPI00210D4EB6|nr:BTAD domain-containing putative transcriptional regulator [Streptomyces sp. ODS25]
MSAEPRLPEQRRPPAADEDPAKIPRLRFRVLGPVQVWRGHEKLSIGSPQSRAMLAALLLRDGRTVTAAELIDALWGDVAPPQALAAVRTYASRLRRSLGHGVLVSESGGYAIPVTAESLDLLDAQHRWDAAQVARSAGDLPKARQQLHAGLTLWDGEPLAGMPGPFADTQRARLKEWRLQLLEARLDIDLELGRHGEVVSELTELAAAYPMRERLRELLMLALYRSGRQGEALAVYADLRRLLAEELGVDPGPHMAFLQERILAADPSLTRTGVEPAGETAPSSAGQVRPTQLPATVPDFTGRTEVVEHLVGRLTETSAPSMVIEAVVGFPGAGKTTLAVHVAHAVRSAFPDGQLYVHLQAPNGRPAEPASVLGAFLRALGTADTAIPDTLQERAALYRSILTDRRVLVLLDDAHDAAQVRPLLPGTEGCAALITSRVRMVDLVGADMVDLDVMSPEEGLRLLTAVVGEERVAAEQEAAVDVVAACGHLPLAIRIVAARLAARRTWTIAHLAARLGDPSRRLDELQAGDLAVRRVLEPAYGRLGPAQARALRLLGLPDGPDFSLDAAAALLDLPAARTEDLLETLVDASLLGSTAPGRYRFHDLVRLYARSCAERDETPAERDTALSRLLDFYLATAAGVYGIARPGDRLVEHLEPTEHPGLAFPHRRAGLDWLLAESGPLLACVRQCATGPFLRKAADLLMAAVDLTESGAHTQQYEEVARTVDAAAQAAGDHRSKGRARLFLTLVSRANGQLQEADDEALRALDAATAAADGLVLSWVPSQRGTIALHEHRYAAARTQFEQAVTAFHDDGNRPGEATALSHLSLVHLKLDDTTTASALAQRGARLSSGQGPDLQFVDNRYALGLVLLREGRHAAAMKHFTDALEILREGGQLRDESMAHYRLAEVHLATGQPASAVTHAEQALALDVPGIRWRRGAFLTVLGKALLATGEPGRAGTCWREALSVYETYGRLSTPEAAEVRSLLGRTPA